MGDFNAGPGLTNDQGLIGTEPNLARPGKRMLSSMSPTIVAKDGKLFMVTGSPGGRTIINTVLMTILDVIDFGMNAQEAVDAGRIHHQWLPDRLSVRGVRLLARHASTSSRRWATPSSRAATRASRRSSSTTRRTTCSKAASIGVRLTAALREVVSRSCRLSAGRPTH